MSLQASDFSTDTTFLNRIPSLCNATSAPPIPENKDSTLIPFWIPAFQDRKVIRNRVHLERVSKCYISISRADYSRVSFRESKQKLQLVRIKRRHFVFPSPNQVPLPNFLKNILFNVRRRLITAMPLDVTPYFLRGCGRCNLRPNAVQLSPLVPLWPPLLLHQRKRLLCCEGKDRKKRNAVGYGKVMDIASFSRRSTEVNGVNKLWLNLVQEPGNAEPDSLERSREVLWPRLEVFFRFCANTGCQELRILSSSWGD